MTLLSPGIEIREKDFSTIVPRVATSIGGIALYATAGDYQAAPPGIPTLVYSENDLYNKFGPPNKTNSAAWHAAAAFLGYADKLYVVRVFDSAGGTSKMACDADAGADLVILSPEDLALKKADSANASKFTAAGTIIARDFGDRPNTLRVFIVDADTYDELVAYETANKEKIQGYNAITNPTPITSRFGKVAPSYTSGLALKLPQLSATQLAAKKDELYVVVMDEDGKYTGTPYTIVETYSDLSKLYDVFDDQNNSIFWQKYINSQSRYIYVVNNPTDLQLSSTAGDQPWGDEMEETGSYLDLDGTKVCKQLLAMLNVNLRGGIASTAVDFSDYNYAYEKFASTEDIDVNLLMTANYGLEIIQKCVEISYNRKDCMTFISPSEDGSVGKPRKMIYPCNEQDVIDFRDSLQFINDMNGSYCVIDSGWKYMWDNYRSTYVWVPLNGDIAGLVARSEYLTEAWYSPAGFNRGGINNVLKLSFNPKRPQRDLLYMHGINPVVSFPGQGVVLFGDKTMQSKPSAFDRINVRRLFIVLEKAISLAAKYSLFEFNDSFTRAQFKAMVEPYLRMVKGRRGLYDFLVVCDESNNTGEIIDRNEFIADIYIKPARSINYITLNFIATKTGVDFSTVLGG